MDLLGTSNSQRIPVEKFILCHFRFVFQLHGVVVCRLSYKPSPHVIFVKHGHVVNHRPKTFIILRRDVKPEQNNVSTYKSIRQELAEAALLDDMTERSHRNSVENCLWDTSTSPFAVILFLQQLQTTFSCLNHNVMRIICFCTVPLKKNWNSLYFPLIFFFIQNTTGFKIVQLSRQEKRCIFTVMFRFKCVCFSV